MTVTRHGIMSVQEVRQRANQVCVPVLSDLTAV